MTALNGIKFVKKSTIDDMATTNDESLYFAEVETYGPDGAGNWYRLYPNGWVEQGGTVPSTAQDTYTAATITFLKEFKDTNYYVNIIEWHNGQQLGISGSTGGEAIHTKSTTSCVISTYSWTYGRLWEAKGWIAED